MVYLSRSERRRAYQQWGGTGAADGAAMAQDLFRQSQSQWRNRHGPLTHGHPNLQAAAASRVGLPHGSGTLPSPPDCCTLSAPTADLTPELLPKSSSLFSFIGRLFILAVSSSHCRSEMK